MFKIKLNGRTLRQVHIKIQGFWGSHKCNRGKFLWNYLMHYLSNNQGIGFILKIIVGFVELMAGISTCSEPLTCMLVLALAVFVWCNILRKL